MNREEKKLAEEMALRYSNNVIREPQIHWAKDMREANEKYKSLWIKLCGRLKEVMVDAVQEELKNILDGSPSRNQKEQDKEDSVDEEDNESNSVFQDRAEDMVWWFGECFPDEPVQDALWEAIPDALECRLMDLKRAGVLPFHVEILPGHLILWPKTKKKKGVRKCQPK